MVLLIPALLLLLGGFGIQLLILHKLRPLRFVNLLAVAYPCFHAWNVFRTPSMFGNLSDLEGVATLIAAALIFLGWGVAWLVFCWKKK